MKRIVYLGVFILIASCSPRISTLLRPKSFDPIPHQKTNGMQFDHTHPRFDTLLNKYVSNGKVDYNGFKNSLREFELYLEELALVNQDFYRRWSKDQKLAFWINAYNAFTIKAILDNYPIRRGSLIGLFFPKNSILQISGIWDKIKFQAAGQSVSLGEIEHDILREQFAEPRIHFVLVCASTSCPDLSGQTYIADMLHEQLDRRTSLFINNTQKGVHIDKDQGRVKLSKIFKWFGEDFVPMYENEKRFPNRSRKENAVLNFISQYINNWNDRSFLENNQFSLSYLKYDWRLNEKTDPN